MMDASLSFNANGPIQALVADIPVPGFPNIVLLRFRQGGSTFSMTFPGSMLERLRSIAEDFNQAQSGVSLEPEPPAARESGNVVNLGIRPDHS